jgi:hypothetical protein
MTEQSGSGTPGTFAATAVMGMNRREVLVEVADFMQDEVIEHLHSPRSVCPVHDKGGYARHGDLLPHKVLH